VVERCGYFAYLTKPLKRASLYQTLLKAFSPDGQSTSGQQRAKAMEKFETSQVADDVLILVAEDQSANRKLFLAQLKELGCAAVAVANGLQAVAATSQNPSLILMDCQMPELDGFQATRRIRQIEADEGRSRTPIIAVTAQTTAEDRTKCFEAGMDDYLSKPVTSAKLREALEKWLPKRNIAGRSKRPLATETHSAITSNMYLQVLSSLQSSFDTETAQRLMQEFLTSMISTLEDVARDIQEKDAANLKKTAHTLKGLCLSYNANDVVRICLQLEKDAVTSDWASAESQRLAIATHLNDFLRTQSSSGQTAPMKS
jgi:CheY-like chemotaxis protein/HPt (histidine-containing phosphotransfer) domain-containing protein